MSRFFFHVQDGQWFVDLQGTELDNLQAARQEAVRFAGQLLIDKANDFWHSHEWTMRVTDENDLTLFELMFIATDSAAVRGQLTC